VPRPRPHRGPRVILQMVTSFERWDCINAGQRERRRSPGANSCTSLLRFPSHPQNAGKLRGFLRKALGFTAETDCLLEQSGFEPLVPLTCTGLGLGGAGFLERHMVRIVIDRPEQVDQVGAVTADA
jgi:hypothetical protein